jgi:uncharacterized protein DUF5916/cellulose/xylan binding protein with CBM9 domain
MRLFPFIAGVLALASSSLVFAADPPALQATRLPEGLPPLTIDGRVNDEAWQQVEPYTEFTEQDPIEGAPASERTEVRVLYDAVNLYVGVVCLDTEPNKIIVSQAKRDSTLTDTDAVIFVLDTFNDHQNAFVFGTNPLGIEYDGQVSGEGQTSAVSTPPSAGSGGSTSTTRGGINAFNPNWDGDWTVKAQTTERGWEAEFVIPFKTLRYAPGTNRTWGFNVWRNIRRKNEQVFLAPIPRGFDIYRVSLAATLTGLDLAAHRDLKAIPYVLGSANKDYALASNSLDRNAEIGGDVKWGVTPSLTADFTYNTDFAQVEADDEQVNLTRFDLFFPEKRPFFLENASTFQFGAPQQIDLFFSRRIGLSTAGEPIPIIGGARLSGKVGHYDIGVLDMQTKRAQALGTNQVIAPTNNFGVIRVQREVGRSTYGAIFVNRQSSGSTPDNYNRAYGIDANMQMSSNAKLFTFLARTDSAGGKGSDYSGRVFYSFSNNLWQIAAGYSQVGRNFNPEVGFVPRVGYRRPEYRVFFQPQPRRWPWIRRISPHSSYNSYYGLDGQLQSSNLHMHYFEIQPARGGRFGEFVDRAQDRPIVPFVVYSANGRKVIIPPGLYTWYQWSNEYSSDPSAALSGSIRYRLGGFYDGDYKDIELQATARAGARFVTSLGWTRQMIKLKYGDFNADLVPLRVSYSFTTLASIQALVQYNSASTLVTSNIRLALLNRSGTGLFIVYNDRRDTSTFDPRDVLGRSFVAKYTRLLDF